MTWLLLARRDVPVGFEFAIALQVVLLNVFECANPVHEELALDLSRRLVSGCCNQDVVRSLRRSQDRIEAVAEREQAESERQEAVGRGDHPAAKSESGRTVILVGD